MNFLWENSLRRVIFRYIRRCFHLAVKLTNFVLWDKSGSNKEISCFQIILTKNTLSVRYMHSRKWEPSELRTAKTELWRQLQSHLWFGPKIHKEQETKVLLFLWDYFQRPKIYCISVLSQSPRLPSCVYFSSCLLWALQPSVHHLGGPEAPGCRSGFTERKFNSCREEILGPYSCLSPFCSRPTDLAWLEL